VVFLSLHGNKKKTGGISDQPKEKRKGQSAGSAKEKENKKKHEEILKEADGVSSF